MYIYLAFLYVLRITVNETLGVAFSEGIFQIQQKALGKCSNKMKCSLPSMNMIVEILENSRILKPSKIYFGFTCKMELDVWVAGRH